MNLTILKEKLLEKLPQLACYNANKPLIEDIIDIISNELNQNITQDFKWNILDKPLYIGWTFYHNYLLKEWEKQNPRPKDPKVLNHKEIEAWYAEDKRLRKLCISKKVKLKNIEKDLGFSLPKYPENEYEPIQKEKLSSWYTAKDEYKKQIIESTIFDIGNRCYYVVYEEKPSNVYTLDKSDTSGLDFHYTDEEACDKKILAYIEFEPNLLGMPESPFK
jgi:hypothetical protein